MAEVAERSRQIAFFEERVARDSAAALDLAQLAGLYVQRARETADGTDFRRAEDAARRSIASLDRRSGRAHLALASSLVAQHRFAEAREVAAHLCDAEPDVPAYRALLGEIAIDLGDDELARATFAALDSLRDDLAVAPRLARWAELTGRPDEALAILGAAVRAADRSGDLPREQVAWFHLRLGDLHARAGRPDAAEAAYRAGLAVEPNDHRLFAALARLAALRGDWRRAIREGQRAAAVVADPATLALVGDAFAALGESAKAESYYAPVEQAALRLAAGAAPPPSGSTAPGRAAIAFLLDHDRHAAAALALARREAAARRDVAACDLLAWALHKTGDHAAAREASRDALRLGTRDASLHFHAGMIALALGERDEARRHLETALAIDPRFHPADPARARAALDSLASRGALGGTAQ